MHFALKRAHQRILFMNSDYYKSNGYQLTIQLLVVSTREIYIRTQAVSAKRLNVER